MIFVIFIIIEMSFCDLCDLYHHRLQAMIQRPPACNGSSTFSLNTPTFRRSVAKKHSISQERMVRFAVNIVLLLVRRVGTVTSL